jgi:hypothetical protein
MMKRSILALTIAALLVGAGPAWAGNLILNPSFGTGDFTDWTTNDLEYTSIESNYDGYTPYTGGYFLSMGNADYYGTISQMVSGLTVGEQYNLYVDLATNSDPNSFGISFGGQTVLTPTNIPDSNDAYVEYDFTVTATSTTETLTLSEEDIPDYFALGYVGMTPVPEPTSVTMLDIGAFGILGYAWRRHKKAAVPAACS